MTDQSKCGYVGIVGRPNVGKSTLMNQILGVKLAITAPKPQTTRHHILGIKTTSSGQMIFVDTPGIHIEQPRAINRYMNRIARAVLADVQIVLWLIEAERITEEDRAIGRMLKQAQGPVMAVINKIDRLSGRDALLPLTAEIDREWSPEAIWMVSALKGNGIEELENGIIQHLPFSAPMYSEDEITDRSERFLAAEFIREQITRQTHAEVPYATTVEIEQFGDDNGLCRIGAVIWVEREGQKGILIGKKGATLKRIGSEARANLQTLLQRKVHLDLWVKTRDGWRDNQNALRAFGYTE